MFDRSQLLTLTLFCGVYIAWGLTDSIQAPFYPIEASSKGATPSEYGLVFGVIHLAIFIAGPLFGKYMHTLKVKRVYFFGVFLTGFCAIVFGTLDLISSKAAFLGCSYSLRIIEGIAEAAAWSAAFSMLLSMFPRNVATVYAITEASFSLAEMVGPTLGALLFGYGGFTLPFVFCGVLCLLTGLLTFFVLPGHIDRNSEQLSLLTGSLNDSGDGSIPPKRPLFQVSSDNIPEDSILNGASWPDSSCYISSSESNDKGPSLVLPNNDDNIIISQEEKDLTTKSDCQSTVSRSIRPMRTRTISCTASVASLDMDLNDVSPAASSGVSLLSTLSNCKVLMALCGTVYAASCQGFLEATLEPFLEAQFQLTITSIGLTFLGLSLPYFFASTLWGYVCDHWCSPVFIQPLGSIVTILGLLILGPAAYLPESSLIGTPSHTETICGLALIGIGTAALLVSSFTAAQKAALEDQNMTSDDCYSVISGVWTSSFALGNFIGPSIGGFLIEGLGFRQTTVVFQLLGFVMLILDIVNLTCCWNSRRSVMQLKRVSQSSTVQMDLYERMP